MRARSPYHQLPLPWPDLRLAAARAALAAADHAGTIADRRRSNAALAARLADLAAARRWAAPTPGSPPLSSLHVTSTVVP